MIAAPYFMRGARASIFYVIYLALLLPSIANAKVRALIVGIDHYQSLPKLSGAVNDARDIASVIESFSDSEVHTLIDQQANFRNIKNHWFDMLDRSQRGDSLVFSYAGHGSRVPELIPGSEADGQDDVFVLGGFEKTGLGVRELIRDNQLFEWFRQAEGRGVQVLFIADSCHSGTMTRAADMRVARRRTRQVDLDFSIGLKEELQLELSSIDQPKSASSGGLELPFLTFLSAGLEGQQIPEISVKSLAGTPIVRGALSYVVARALEGAADRDGDRMLSRAELRHYVLENVRVLSERQQTPELSPLTQPDREVLPVPFKGIDLVSVVPTSPVRVFSTGLEAADKRALLDQNSNLLWVDSLDESELFLDTQSGHLLSSVGDLIATGLFLSDRMELQARFKGALAKRVALQTLRKAASRRLLETALTPDANSHRLGSRIVPEYRGMRGPYVIVVNLAGDGTIQLVYPLARMGDAIKYGTKPWNIPLEVSDPLGEDHMLAFAFEEAQPKFLKALERLDGSRSPARLVSMVLPFLARSEVEIGIVAMFSRP